jgi:hypothetical protein
MRPLIVGQAGCLALAASPTYPDAHVIEFPSKSLKKRKFQSPRLQAHLNYFADLAANVRVCVERLAEGNVNVYS